MAGTFGELLRKWRKQSGTPVADLAKRAGVTPGFLNLVERDERAPTPKVLEKLLRELEIPVPKRGPLLEAWVARRVLGEPGNRFDVITKLGGAVLGIEMKLLPSAEGGHAPGSAHGVQRALQKHVRAYLGKNRRLAPQMLEVLRDKDLLRVVESLARLPVATRRQKLRAICDLLPP